MLDKLLEEAVALRFPQPLQDNLLGGLGGDAAGVVRERLRRSYFVAHHRRLHDGLGVAKADFPVGVFNLVDHSPQSEHVNVAGVGVELDRDVLARCRVVLLECRSQGDFDGLQHLFLGQVPFGR